MIAHLQPLPIGNAVRCLLAPAAGATRTRVLRKTTDDIASETDVSAAVVFDGDEKSFIDIETLFNGTVYFYRAFDLVGSSWVASASAAATPAATGELRGPDVLGIVRDRFRSGLKAEVAAGRLRHETGSIPTLTAPPAFENTKWPVVSVHYRTGAPEARAIGEQSSDDVFDAADLEWIAAEGWLERSSIEVVGWSLNSDERNDLRLALKKVVIGNLAVFEDAGMCLIEPSQNDVDDMESYGAPVFSTVTTISSLAPVSVESRTAPISDVTVAASAID